MARPTDLCLAATVAADLGVPVDPHVERCVSAASGAIAALCGRAFERATVTEYPASYGRPYVLLARPPLVEVLRVTEAGVELAAASFTVAGDLAAGGLLYRLAGLWPVTAHVGGLVTLTADSHQGHPGALAVTYTGGYVTPGQLALDASLGPATLPAEVEEAAILEACALYRGRGRDSDVSAESLGDWSVSYRERGAGQRLASPRAELLVAPHVLWRAS
ncbi:hypothetical protein LZ198_42505 [Myxococcus sp. K15C18031901]|uniref:hypothetical protein n=1 Tax=Myxococcus dinghuensis TaxID=2906761 RepID=UPI0020A779FA|nr:hypothetical protein [Myxococcus dinghuensis]MCP3105537.1 hypothetical protein [Myxococcus dinghuensis]